MAAAWLWLCDSREKSTCKKPDQIKVYICIGLLILSYVVLNFKKQKDENCFTLIAAKSANLKQ